MTCFTTNIKSKNFSLLEKHSRSKCNVKIKTNNKEVPVIVVKPQVEEKIVASGISSIFKNFNIIQRLSQAKNSLNLLKTRIYLIT